MTRQRYRYTLTERDGTVVDVVAVRGRYYVNTAELANLNALRLYANGRGATIERHENTDVLPRRRRTRATVAHASPASSTPAELAQMLGL